MCDQNSKIASLGRFVLPVLQGAAAGASAAPGPSTGLGAPSGWTNFFRGFGASEQAKQQRALLEEERADKRFTQGQESVRTNLAIESAQRQAAASRLAEEREKRLADAQIADMQLRQEQLKKPALIDFYSPEEQANVKGEYIPGQEIRPLLQDVQQIVPATAGRPETPLQFKRPLLAAVPATVQAAEVRQGQQSALEDQRQRNRVALLKMREQYQQGRQRNFRVVTDNEGKATGEVVSFDSHGNVQVSNVEGLSGKRFTATPADVMNRQKAITANRQMVQNIKEATQGIRNGENIVANITLLEAQLATLGNVAKGLGGEAGTLATQDVERAQKTIPGIVESLASGQFEFARDIVDTKIRNLERLVDNVSRLMEPSPQKPVAPIKPRKVIGADGKVVVR